LHTQIITNNVREEEVDDMLMNMIHNIIIIILTLLSDIRGEKTKMVINPKILKD